MRCCRCDGKVEEGACNGCGREVLRSELMVALPVTDVRVVRWERDRADFALREAS